MASSMIILAFLAATANPGEKRDHNLAWVMAYSTYVSLNCPGWKQDDTAFQSLFAIKPQLGPRWDEDGDLTIALKKGGRAVERAKAADPTFCETPWRTHPEHADLLARVLHREQAR